MKKPIIISISIKLDTIKIVLKSILKRLRLI